RGQARDPGDDVAAGAADRVVDELHAVGVGVVLVGLEADVGPRGGQRVRPRQAVVAGGAGRRGVARDAEVLVVLEVPHGADRGVRRGRRTAVGRQVARARDARGVVDGRSSYGRAEGPGLEVLLHVRPAGAAGEADVGRAAA